ncbi:MAG: hypothetical protein V4671_09215 [Armatimonadota bacterium]
MNLRIIPKRKTVTRLLTVSTALMALLLGATASRPASAFGGEDPLNGKPWHHEDITRTAAMDPSIGFTAEAANALAWHADYIDSYLYNPLWWAKGGLHRLKSSLATGTELEKLHFDDLFARDRVEHTWRRYLSGTIAGLVWARENNDVSAAQNIVGVSLHAIQDFYSHSNWIDAPARRSTTYFQMSISDRASLLLYTGGYEKNEHQAIKHHGKIAPAATVFNMPGVKTLMEIAASPLSPLQNTPIVEHYKQVKDGVSVQPYLPFFKEKGIKVPENTVYLAPAGIALDNTWVSEIGVQQRGLTDINALQAFDTAKSLATRCSIQWLKRIELAMGKTDENRDFWKKVKETPVDQNTREREYENFSKFPYTFLSAGSYPVELPGTGDEYFLRLKIKTSDAAFAGTNADIRLKTGNINTLLDYLPRGMPMVADDFEDGDTRVYVAGPFSALPPSITLHNDSPNFRATMAALGNSLNDMKESVGNLFLSLIGGHADLIGTEKQVWLPEDLARVRSLSVGETFNITVDGEHEGKYLMVGRIKKVAEGGEGIDAWAQYTVQMGRLDCLRESASDRGSNSDEPFVLALCSSLPGDTSRYRTAPFKDIDKGESAVIDYTFTSGRIPKVGGAMILPISVLESDDETDTMRRKLLDEFAGKVEDQTAPSERGFLTALDSARAADWKLEHLEVYAWTRNRSIKAGKVYDSRIDQWIDGGKSKDFTLNAAGLKDTGITTEELLAPEPAGGAQTPGQPAPTPTPTPTPTPAPGQPLPPPPGVPAGGNSAVTLDGLKGKWLTNNGATLTIEEAVTTAGTPATLHASAKKGGIPLEDYYLQVENGEVRGLWKSTPNANMATDWSSFGIVTITSFSIDGNSFSGKVVLKNGNTFAYSGTRIKDGSENPGNTLPGNGNTGVVPPTAGRGGNARIGDGRFYSLDNFDVCFDELKPGRTGNTLELFATFKNISSRNGQVTVGTFDPTLVDATGVVIKDHGNLYRASGEHPERFARTVVVDSGGQARVRYVFDIPSNVSRLKSLRIQENNARPVLADISDMPVPGAEDAAAEPEQPGGITPLTRTDFAAVDEIDVRVDGVRRGRSGKTLEAFVTVKNPTSKTQALSAGSLDLTVTDADGAGTRRVGNLYLATGDEPERLQGNILLAPGGQAKVRYLFELISPEAKLTRITIKGYRPPPRVFNLPDLPDAP